MKPGDPNWNSRAQAPVIVDDPNTAHWDDEADVVIVGYGGAGVCAAIEAATRGARVLALDRFAGGGATRLSGGVYYGGGGTRIQKEAGVDDDVDNMYAYLKHETQGAVSDATLWRFCEESSPSLDWLMKHGVRFKGRLYPTKAQYPPAGYYLYHSGNEMLADFRRLARPAARGHRTLQPQDVAGMTGLYYFDALARSAQQLGVRLINHAPVWRLITDRQGTVVGVEANCVLGSDREEHARLAAKWNPLNPMQIGRRRRIQRKLEAIEGRPGKLMRIRAINGVILTTGGFIHNWDMVKAELPIDHASTIRIGSPGCDGSGIRLGETVGGATAYMDQADNGRPIRPEFLTKAVLVNERGERFIDETAYQGAIGEIIVSRRYKKVWLIINRAMRDQMMMWAKQWKTRTLLFYYSLPVYLTLLITAKKGSTVEALARKLDMDPAILGNTIDAYNQAALGLRTDSFNKDAENMELLKGGPFYAIDQSVGAPFAPMVAFTSGGLSVDETSGAVQRPDGKQVKGLYAAGRAAVGVCSISYVSGMSIADTVFSGRRAGRSVSSCNIQSNVSPLRQVAP